MTDNDDVVATQNRCPYCLTLQPPQNIVAFSYSETTCATCGQFSWRMTREEYWETLSAARAASETVDFHIVRPPRLREPPT